MDTKNNQDNILKELKESFASFSENIKKLKSGSANGPEDEKRDEMLEMMDSFAQRIYSAINYLHQRVNSTQDDYYKHCGAGSGHVPSLKAGAMQRFLKMANMEDDYEISKPTIFCSASRLGKVVEAEYRKSTK